MEGSPHLPRGLWSTHRHHPPTAEPPPPARRRPRRRPPPPRGRGAGTLRWCACPHTHHHHSPPTAPSPQLVQAVPGWRAAADHHTVGNSDRVSSQQCTRTSKNQRGCRHNNASIGRIPTGCPHHSNAHAVAESHRASRRACRRRRPPAGRRAPPRPSGRSARLRPSSGRSAGSECPRRRPQECPRLRGPSSGRSAGSAPDAARSAEVIRAVFVAYGARLTTIRGELGRRSR